MTFQRILISDNMQTIGNGTTIKIENAYNLKLVKIEEELKEEYIHVCSECGKLFKNPRTLKSNDCGKVYICSKCKVKSVQVSSKFFVGIGNIVEDKRVTCKYI